MKRRNANLIIQGNQSMGRSDCKLAMYLHAHVKNVLNQQVLNSIKSLSYYG